ncbi:MAG: AAA family ATPase [Candidatus Dadabacteria bacterium]|nr:AAA family ATPase [Candidatus Dadabacteria bacterium]
MMTQPVCTIIAGPNGAGKTTFAMEFLPETDCNVFLNADMIATALSPLGTNEQHLLKAGKLFLKEVEECIGRREYFAFETTLSGTAHLTRIRRMIEDGWRVNMVYLWIPSAETSLNRVRQRVRQGGHNVPERDIRRRYGRTLRNLFTYAPVCSEIECLDSSTKERRLIFKQRGKSVTVSDRELYNNLKREAEMKEETGAKESVGEYTADTDKPQNGAKRHIGDVDTEFILQCWERGVAKELERKRKLGYDAIIVKNDIIMKLHPDGSMTEICPVDGKSE